MCLPFPSRDSVKLLWAACLGRGISALQLSVIGGVYSWLLRFWLNSVGRAFGQDIQNDVLSMLCIHTLVTRRWVVVVVASAIAESRALTCLAQASWPKRVAFRGKPATQAPFGAANRVRQLLHQQRADTETR